MTDITQLHALLDQLEIHSGDILMVHASLGGTGLAAHRSP